MNAIRRSLRISCASLGRSAASQGVVNYQSTAASAIISTTLGQQENNRGNYSWGLFPFAGLIAGELQCYWGDYPEVFSDILLDLIRCFEMLLTNMITEFSWTNLVEYYHIYKFVIHCHGYSPVLRQSNRSHSINITQTASYLADEEASTSPLIHIPTISLKALLVCRPFEL